MSEWAIINNLDSLTRDWRAWLGTLLVQMPDDEEQQR